MNPSPFSSEYYDYCEKLNLIPTDKGYELWLKNKIDSISGKPQPKEIILPGGVNRDE